MHDIMLSYAIKYFYNFWNVVLCIQERAMLAAGEKHEHSPIMTLGYNTWRSTKSSHTDSRRGWSEGETGHGEKVPGM